MNAYRNLKVENTYNTPISYNCGLVTYTLSTSKFGHLIEPMEISISIKFSSSMFIS
ncbi:hypothetical protein LguiA_035702 [Lonicera macranthoides]